MVKPGDVVVVDFPGVTGIKRRPAVVASTDTYHRIRPDAILGLLTSQVAAATGPTDCVLQDWQAVGAVGTYKLRSPSAFRAFLSTLPIANLTTIGPLSDQEGRKVQGCLQVALAISWRRTSDERISCDLRMGWSELLGLRT